MREIVFDTETTGFDSQGADRITELGCIELIDWLPTGKQFHAYLDPERDVPPRVVEITGLTAEFLRGKPKFADVAEDFLAFIGDAPLIAHNAQFDRGFINAELGRMGRDPLPEDRFIDTLAMANAAFPGSPASLDALCKRFGISLSSRDKHGAIIDSELLAGVYLELRGGRERSLSLEPTGIESSAAIASAQSLRRQRPTPLSPRLTETEAAAHAAFIESLGDGAIWNKINRRRKSVS
jgi:DNA polymerase-3 subunit epsilon